MLPEALEIAPQVALGVAEGRRAGEGAQARGAPLAVQGEVHAEVGARVGDERRAPARRREEGAGGEAEFHVGLGLGVGDAEVVVMDNQGALPIQPHLPPQVHAHLPERGAGCAGRTGASLARAAPRRKGRSTPVRGFTPPGAPHRTAARRPRLRVAPPRANEAVRRPPPRSGQGRGTSSSGTCRPPGPGALAR